MFVTIDLGHWFKVLTSQLKWDMYLIASLKKYQHLLEQLLWFQQKDKRYRKRMQNLIESKI